MSRSGLCSALSTTASRRARVERFGHIELGAWVPRIIVTGSAFDSAVGEFAGGVAALDRGNFAVVNDKFKDDVGELSRAKL